MARRLPAPQWPGKGKELLLAAVGLLLACDQPISPPPGRPLLHHPRPLVVGELYRDDEIEILVPIRNATARRIGIAGVILSCTCTDLISHPATLEPGAGGEIAFRLDPSRAGHGDHEVIVRALVREGVDVTPVPIHVQYSYRPALRAEPEPVALRLPASEADVPNPSVWAEVTLHGNIALQPADYQIVPSSPLIRAEVRDEQPGRVTLLLSCALEDVRGLRESERIAIRSPHPQVDGREIEVICNAEDVVGISPGGLVFRGLNSGEPFEARLTLTSNIGAPSLRSARATGRCRRRCLSRARRAQSCA